MNLPRLLRRIRPSRPTAAENREALERGRKLCEAASPLNGRIAVYIMQAAWRVRTDEAITATRRGLIVGYRGTGIPIDIALEDGHRGDLVNVGTHGIYAVGPELPR